MTFPLTLLLQGSLTMAIAALTKSTSWAVVAVFIPSASWTMYFYPTYPGWFTLFSMGVFFLSLFPFGWAGEVHSHYWQAHPFLSGKDMYRTAWSLDQQIDDENVSDKKLKRRQNHSFVQKFMGMMFWRSLLTIAVLLAAHIPMELDWARTHIFTAMGIQLGTVAVAWILFYFLFEYIGSDEDRAVFSQLFKHKGELIPFTVVIALFNLLFVAGYALGEHFIAPADWTSLWNWLLPMIAGGVLAVLAFVVGRFVPIREPVTSKTKQASQR